MRFGNFGLSNILFRKNHSFQSLHNYNNLLSLKSRKSEKTKTFSKLSNWLLSAHLLKYKAQYAKIHISRNSTFFFKNVNFSIISAEHTNSTARPLFWMNCRFQIWHFWNRGLVRTFLSIRMWQNMCDVCVICGLCDLCDFVWLCVTLCDFVWFVWLCVILCENCAPRAPVPPNWKKVAC